MKKYLSVPVTYTTSYVRPGLKLVVTHILDSVLIFNEKYLSVPIKMLRNHIENGLIFKDSMYKVKSSKELNHLNHCMFNNPKYSRFYRKMRGVLKKECTSYDFNYSPYIIMWFEHFNLTKLTWEHFDDILANLNNFSPTKSGQSVPAQLSFWQNYSLEWTTQLLRQTWTLMSNLSYCILYR